MENVDWVRSVIVDLRCFCERNDLNIVADELGGVLAALGADAKRTVGSKPALPRNLEKPPS